MEVEKSIVDFPEIEYPQIMFQFKHPNADQSMYAGRPSPTKYLKDKLRAIRELENDLDHKMPNISPKYVLQGPPTLELPVLRVGESAPTGATVYTKNTSARELLEVHVQFGARGHMYSQYAIRFDEQGNVEGLIFDPFGGNERRVDPSQPEFTIVLTQTVGLFSEIEDNPQCRLGIRYDGIMKTQRPASVLTDADYGAVEHRVIEAIQGPIDRGFDGHHPMR